MGIHDDVQPTGDPTARFLTGDNFQVVAFEFLNGRKAVGLVSAQTREVVDDMVRWCYSGPPAAVVKDVVVEYEVPEGLQRFEVKRGK